MAIARDHLELLARKDIKRLVAATGADEDLIRDATAVPYHLGLSQAGHPKHPLYIPYAQAPEPWATAG